MFFVVPKSRLNSTGFKDWDKKSIYKVINYEFETKIYKNNVYDVI